MRGFAWYLKRLSVMSPAEVAHRVGEAWGVSRLRRSQIAVAGRSGLPAPSSFGFCAASASQLPALTWGGDLSDAEGERLVAGEWPALGFDWRWGPEVEVWHRAPDTGRRWPQAFFADIPYRAGNPTGDVRVAWEPARLQQLVSLALVAQRGGDMAPRAAALAEDILASWLDANPPYHGIHYLSAMECALRILAVCHAIDLLRDRLQRPAATWAGLVRLVASHAPLIAKRLSLHSSAGNHTIAEAVGLLYAGVLFPEFVDAAQWRETGLRLLVQEAPRQVLPDGGGIEQAFWYQLFIVDLLGLARALLEHHGLEVPAAIAAAVDRGRGFLQALADGPDDLPAIGDSDNGYALSRHLRISWAGRRAALPQEITFADAGYTVWQADSPVPFRLVLDHGPLGMQPACGHGHADALAVHLSVAGRDLLMDPGTFTYTGDPVWRRWFRGTAAHNTVCVDGEDQARQETAFQWSVCHRASLVRSEDRPDGAALLLARHDGYRRRGVTHWRGLVRAAGGALAVWDCLTGEGEHLAELHWHCPSEPSGSPDGILRLSDEPPVALRIAGGVVSIHCGEEKPTGGWWSRTYGERVAAATVRVKYEGALPHEFLTSVSVGGLAPSTVDAWSEQIGRLRDWVGEALIKR